MRVETKSNQNWLMDRLLATQFLGRVVYEPFRAAWSGDPEVIWKFAATCLIFVIFILGLDGKILFYYGKGNVYNHKLYSVLQFLIAMSPILYHGIFQATLRTIFIFELRKNHLIDLVCKMPSKSTQVLSVLNPKRK